MNATAAPLTDPNSRRQLTQGWVEGRIEPNGCHAWRGLRYAAPPVGAWRWRAPQPALPWEGTLAALQHGALAPQFSGLLAPGEPAHYGEVIGDEDCLHLAVFAPHCAADAVPQGQARLPVMVWIHGGGNAVGTANTFDVASNLAARDGVVVVTVNYRLGVLGWFTHPALQQQPDLQPEERSGNFALLDLLAALRWVQQNIAAFGGDPDCVTVFGESAGGQQVLLLMASPLAQGLFHRAIAQSPVSESFSVEEAVHGVDVLADSLRTGTQARVEDWAAAAGRPDVLGAAPTEVAAFLRHLSPAQLLAAYRPGSAGIYLAPRPTRDGVVLPLAPLHTLFASGQFNRVPVILGSNRDEFRTFLADKPEHSRLLLGKIPLLRDRAAYLAESGFMSRGWRALHVDRPADALLTGGHTEVWTYRFDWDEAPAVPFIRPDLLLGACHAAEMPFVFRDREGVFDLFKVNTPWNRKSREQVSDAMAAAWTSFARHGAPRTLPAGVAWPRRSSIGSQDSLIFDSARDGGLRMAGLRSSLPALQAELLQGRAAVPAPLRAQVFARTFLWSPVLAGHATLVDYAEVQQRWGGDPSPQRYRPAVEI
ncbi:carboxylesterase/lipase family protein [Ideonella sp.]|uniref:carboxylesterase/lipase family protein n=1 Tax=Ideonella sp. TaxID=1929293 RepID=UPI003BB4977A